MFSKVRLDLKRRLVNWTQWNFTQFGVSNESPQPHPDNIMKLGHYMLTQSHYYSVLIENIGYNSG